MPYPIEEHILYIFTDGASRPGLGKTPKRVWWMGVFFVHINEFFEQIDEDMSDYIWYVWATNNDMELQASVNGLKIAKLKDLSMFKKIMVITDSRFVCDNIGNAVFWKWNWTHWETSYWDPVIHKKQRKEVTKYIKEIFNIHRLKVQFDWVKGHSDDENNKKADKAAVKWTQSLTKVQGSNTSVRKKFFKNPVRYKKCYIPHATNEFYIHIYTARKLRKWRFRYNYEVVSQDSEYFMHEGWIFYEKATLSAEYIYLVRLANDGSNSIANMIATETKEIMRNKIIEAGYPTNIFYWKGF